MSLWKLKNTQNINKSETAEATQELTGLTAETHEDQPRLEAIYACLEAQIDQLREYEQKEFIEKNTLPRQIEVTLETFFEEVGVEDPELMAKLYIQEYGVDQLFDAASAKTPKLSVVSVVRLKRFTRFVVSLLHDNASRRFEQAT